MPLAMDHPRYRYTPWTPERRRAASEAAKARWTRKREEQKRAAEQKANSLVAQIRKTIALAEQDMEIAWRQYFSAKDAVGELRKLERFMTECEPLLKKYNLIEDAL